MDNLYSHVAHAKKNGAQQEQQSTQKKKRRSLSRAGIASGLVVCILAVTFTDLTPEARANTLLAKAIAEDQRHRPSPSRWLRIRQGDQYCDVRVSSSTSPGSSFCDTVHQNLIRLGWKWNDLLSPESFQQWRASLTHKQDAVQKDQKTIQLTTVAEDNPLQRATIQFHNTDYRTLAGTYVWLTQTGTFEFSVEETAAPVSPGPSHTSSLPSVPANHSSDLPARTDSFTAAEIRMRLAVIKLGLEDSTLLDIQRTEAGPQLWGAVPTAEIKNRLTGMIHEIPHAQISVKTEVEYQADPTPLPWNSFQGDAPPLAAETLRELYPSNDTDRQRLQNSLDRLTRQLVGLARTREGLLAASSQTKEQSNDLAVHQALQILNSRMTITLKSIAEELSLLLGETEVTLRPLSTQKTEQLYMLAHDLVFLSRRSEATTLEDAIQQIRTLLADN